MWNELTKGGSIAQDLTVTRYLKGANQSAFLEVKFGQGDGGMEAFFLGSFNRVDFTNIDDGGGGAYWELNDTGNNYDKQSNEYVCPVAGVYRVTTQLRISDDNGGSYFPSFYSFDTMSEFPMYVSYGHGAGTTEGDSPTFKWFQTADYRNGSFNMRISHFDQGDRIKMFTYADSSIAASDGSMNIELLYAD